MSVKKNISTKEKIKQAKKESPKKESPKKESPKKESPKKETTTIIRKKKLGKEPSPKQSKLFTKLITNPNFIKKLLVTQILGKDNFLRILNFNEDQTCWFVDLDKELFLYNETNKKLLYYGNILNNPKVESSKNIPWNEVQ